MNIVWKVLGTLLLLGLSLELRAQVSTTVVEYYNTAIDAYFVTGRPNEQSALDSSASFRRTGMTFKAIVASSAPASLTPVCRYYISLANPFTSSHFYGAKGGDCELIASLQPAGFTSEGFDFATDKQTSSGLCPPSAPAPVYRAFRAAANGKTPNHRYSASAASYSAMVSQGWTGEGVKFCVTSVTDIGAPVAASSAAGYWVGTSSTGSNAYGIIAPTGETWVMYTDTAGRNYLSGVIYAQASWSGGVWNTSIARDFNFDGRTYVDARISGNYSPRNQISGSIFYPAYNAATTFNASYRVEFEQTPSLATITGTYTGSAVTLNGSEASNVGIQANGAVTGSTASGCNFSGSIAPMPGANLYRTTVTFQGAACGGTVTAGGAAYYDLATRTLNVVTLDNSRTQAYVYLGKKN